ncbi:zinc finger protein 62 homolog [Culicoides brevitarsis]|uniref:zinc finger protein 62 homolog n=1 Tax=Culicoides brevitarsis TaxID=469753 RepID=UPI00307C62A8
MKPDIAHCCACLATRVPIFVPSGSLVATYNLLLNSNQVKLEPVADEKLLFCAKCCKKLDEIQIFQSSCQQSITFLLQQTSFEPHDALRDKVEAGFRDLYQENVSDHEILEAHDEPMDEIETGFYDLQEENEIFVPEIVKCEPEIVKKEEIEQENCVVCKKTFPLRQKFANPGEMTIIQHILEEHCRKTINFFGCKLCDCTYKTSMGLKVHLKKIHSGQTKMYFCKFCQESFVLKRKMHSHLRQFHPNEASRYICDICKREFNQFASIKNHMERRHTEERECPTCFRTFEKGLAFTKHRKSCGETYQCHICSAILFTAATLEKHIERLHMPSPPCDICGEAFSCQTELDHHKKMAHMVKSKVCEQCGMTFYTDNGLQNHIKYTHLGIKNKFRGTQSWCEVCQKLEPHETKKQHERQARFGKRYKCDQCEKAFFTGARLKKHYHVHTKTRPFNCKLCDRGYYHTSYLKAHYQRAHGSEYLGAIKKLKIRLKKFNFGLKYQLIYTFKCKMVRNYKPKTDRPKISEADIAAAVEDVIKHQISVHQAALKHKINQQTLYSRIRKLRSEISLDGSSLENIENVLNDPNISTIVTQKTAKKIFTDQQEEELAKFILDRPDPNITRTQCREIAYEFAKQQGVVYPSSWDKNQMAGIDWMDNFRKRRPEIQLKKAPKTIRAENAQNSMEVDRNNAFSWNDWSFPEPESPPEIQIAHCCGCLSTETPIFVPTGSLIATYNILINSNQIKSEHIPDEKLIFCANCCKKLDEIQNFQSSCQNATNFLLQQTSLDAHDELQEKVEAGFRDLYEENTINHEFLEPEIIKWEPPIRSESTIVENDEIAQENCSICNKFFPVRQKSAGNGEITFDKHMVLEHSLKTLKAFRCTICDLYCNTEVYFLNHFRTIHEGKQKLFFCEFCPEKFLLKPKLVAHVKKFHKNDEIRLVCDICHLQFPTKEKLEKHIAAKHISTRECPSCHGKFEKGSKYINHRKSCGNIFQCHLCSSSLVSAAALEYHIARFHVPSPPCETCGETFACQADLDHHKRLTHTTKTRICDQCGASFYTSGGLKRHIRHIHMGIKHSETGKQSWCQVCQKLEPHRTKLKHEKEAKHGRRYKCDQCEKSFFSNLKLKKHSYVHSKTRPYNCKLCDTGYYQSSYLKAHYQRVHNSEYLGANKK